MYVLHSGAHTQPCPTTQEMGTGSSPPGGCHGDAASFRWRGEAVRLPGGTEEGRAPNSIVLSVAVLSFFVFIDPPSPLRSVIGPADGTRCWLRARLRSRQGGGEEGADTHLLHTSISNLLMRCFHPSVLISTCHPTWQVERCILQTVSSSLMRTARSLKVPQTHSFLKSSC